MALQAEPSSTTSETRIVTGEEEIARLRSAFLSRASAKPGGYSYGVNDKSTTIRSAGVALDQATKLLKENPSFGLRHITDIQVENIGAVRKLMGAGFEVRHLEGNKIRFSVSKTEYIETIHARELGEPADQVLWSNNVQLVAQATRIFEALWEQAVPAEARLGEWEDGARPSITTLIREPEKIRRRFVEMATDAKKEMLLLLPTTAAFHREENIGVIDLIEGATARGVRVTVVSPTDPDIAKRIETSNALSQKHGKEGMELVPIPESKAQGTMTILVVDQDASLVVEQKSRDEKEFLRAVGLAIYSTSEPIVRANVRFVQRVKEIIAMARREEMLLQKETFQRKQAELLQDILTHDIRNFNQIVMSSAEALRGAVVGEDAVLVDNILRATEGSSALVERAKSLSAILSGGGIPLVPVDLEGSIKKSLSVVAKSHTDKSIILAAPLASKSRVLADGLLDQVFTNLISNAVRYTNASDVPLEIEVDEVTGPSAQDDKEGIRYIRVAVIDQGRGIPDSMKGRVFKRYQDTKSGSGLGLSIVHALVVDRYRGRIVITDRVRDHYSRGTRIEVWLQKG